MLLTGKKMSLCIIRLDFRKFATLFIRLGNWLNVVNLKNQFLLKYTFKRLNFRNLPLPNKGRQRFVNLFNG